MKTIIVATDFSSVALNAAKYAADMALAINADIFLLHVYQLPVSYGDVPIAIDEDDISRDCEGNMLELKEQLLNRSGGKLSIKTEIRMGVFFYKELKRICENIKPYAVVIGSQGTSATERVLIGSHAVYAMQHLRWPLITVPHGVSFSCIKKIGLACNLVSVTNTVPLDEIKLLVNDLKAELHILYIEKPFVFNADRDYESVLLQDMMAAIKPHYHHIAGKHIDDEIINFAEGNNIDLLMVLPGRPGLFGRLMHKSHTKQLVLHSQVPVLALHQ